MTSFQRGHRQRFNGTIGLLQFTDDANNSSYPSYGNSLESVEAKI